MILVNANSLVRGLFGLLVIAPLAGFADWATVAMDPHRFCDHMQPGEVAKAACPHRIVHLQHPPSPAELKAKFDARFAAIRRGEMPEFVEEVYP